MYQANLQGSLVIIKEYVTFLIPLMWFKILIPDFETEQDPSGPSQVQKPLHVSWFLFAEKDFSLLGLPWVPKSRLK